MPEIVIFTKVVIFGKKWRGKVLFGNYQNPQMVVNFQQESGFPYTVGSEPVAHAEEEETGRGDWKRRLEEETGRGDWKRRLEEETGRGDWKRRLEEETGRGDWKRRLEEETGRGDWKRRLEEETGRGCLQVPEEGTHKAAK